MLDLVQKYYGEVLENTEDLKTNACCTIESTPAFVTEALDRIHEEVRSRYYGCGLILPEALAGCRILDLGCGSGRDCYLLSQLVGEEGEIVGVDMTGEQLKVADGYRDYHAEEFGYARSNVEFHRGYIERLDELPLEPESFDIVVSNCVINLSPDKAAVVFVLDAHHTIETGRAFAVCGNTYDMLHASRFREHFEFIGDKSRHFGIFPGCGTSIPFDEEAEPASGGCC